MLKYRSLLFTILILFLNLFLFKNIGSSGVAIFMMGCWVMLLAIHATRYSLKQSSRALILVSIPFFASVSGLVLRASISAQVVLFLSSSWYFLATHYILTTQKSQISSLAEALFVPFTALRTYLASLKVIAKNKRLIDQPLVTNLTYDQKHWFSLATGLIVSIPVIGLLLWLLSAADPIFSSKVHSIISIDIDDISRLSLRLVLSGIFAMFMAPLCYPALEKKFLNPVKKLYTHRYLIEFSVVLSLVLITLGAFLIVQWPYVFATVEAETSLSQFGVSTYSEYVKKGFLELLVVSAVLYGLLWYGLLLQRNLSTKSKYLFSVQMSVFFTYGLFLLSIFRRVWLYQSYHGLSVIRVYGCLLLALIAALTATLLARHFVRKSFITLESIFFAASIVFVGAVNIEQLIVKIHPPTVNNRVDTIYLAQLSADGVAGWEHAFKNAQEILIETDHHVIVGSQSAVLIPETSRRDIAYAGLITKQLYSTKLRLLSTYGAPEEIKREYSNLNRLHKEYLLIKANELSKTENASRSAIEQATTPLVVGRNLSYAVVQSLLLVDFYDEFDQKMSEKTNSVPYLPIYSRFNSPLDLQFNTGCAGSPLCRTPFYETYNPDMSFQTNPTRLEKIFNWNASESKAYRRLNQSMSFEALTELEFRYLELADEINSQEENERSFEIDTDLYPPLLGF